MTRVRAPFCLLALLSAGGFGCGREVAQTAERVPDPGTTLDCSPPTVPVSLPDGAPFGDGREPASELVGDGYGPGEGPGLYVVARDAFRVYLNAELVRESTEPREPVFVPLSVLPGDNVLALVVAAADGRPATLVQLDELDRSYPSDASWRVTDAPLGDFHDPRYDASGWNDAEDLGALGTRPGCDPEGVFPASTAARWIAPAADSGSVAVFRKVVRIAAVGYGAPTSGGLGATPVVVRSFDELADAVGEPDSPAVILLEEGDYDFRRTGEEIVEQQACPVPCENDPSKVADTLLTDDEACPVPFVARTTNDRGLDLGSNKTLVGLGRGAALRGVSVDLGSARNVIIRNVAVYDVNPALVEAGDAFGFDTASQIWLDHCTMKWISDGFTDFRPGSAEVTLSWMHYDGTSPDSCTGKHTRGGQVDDSSVTIHHSYFEELESHSPLVTGANARLHFFDNFLSNNPDYAVGAGCSAEVRLEANVFESVATPTLRTTCSDDPSLGLIGAIANLYRDDVGPHSGGDGGEPHDAVFTPPYAYVLEPAQDAWLRVVSRAGAGGPWALPIVRE